jgi:exopolyphosphatase/guanosine-5'-triphosphate,3'-diphosphate pyrophosphatase
MILKLSRPLGWSARELELAAVVARYHRGAMPYPRGKPLQRLELPDRRVAVELAGVLRLANALDPHNGTAPKLQVEPRDGMLLVHSAGYSPLDRSGENVAAARHLLETVLRRPIMVRTLRIASRA